MDDQRLSLSAHSRSDGSITALVVQPEGEIRAMLVPEAGVDVTEISDHDLVDPVDPERLERLRSEHRVDVTPARGRLVPRGGQAAE